MQGSGTDSGKLNLTITQGATFRRWFFWKTKNELGALVIKNLTGYTAEMLFSLVNGSDSVLVRLSTEDGSILIDGALGRVEVIMAKDITQYLNFNQGEYQLYLTKDSESTRLLEGSVYFSKKAE